MMILLALLIAVVAVSLMMTVLVASTRPLRAHDDPIFGPILGARPAGGVAMRLTGPSWMDFERAPRSPERALPVLPLPAPADSTAPEVTGIRVVSPRHDMATPQPPPRGSERINPNTWGRVRAEAGALKTVRNHIRSESR